MQEFYQRPVMQEAFGLVPIFNKAARRGILGKAVVAGFSAFEWATPNLFRSIQVKSRGMYPFYDQAAILDAATIAGSALLYSKLSLPDFHNPWANVAQALVVGYVDKAIINIPSLLIDWPLRIKRGRDKVRDDFRNRR